MVQILRATWDVRAQIRHLHKHINDQPQRAQPEELIHRPQIISMHG